jgi:hypothetical protein
MRRATCAIRASMQSARGQQGSQRAVELGTHNPPLHMRPLSPFSRGPGISVAPERSPWAAYASGNTIERRRRSSSGAAPQGGRRRTHTCTCPFPCPPLLSLVILVVLTLAMATACTQSFGVRPWHLTRCTRGLSGCTRRSGFIGVQTHRRARDDP